MGGGWTGLTAACRTALFAGLWFLAGAAIVLAGLFVRFLVLAAAVAVTV